MTTYNGNFATSGSSLAWRNLQSTDFISLTPTDPNGVVTGDFAINDSTGVVTIAMTGNAGTVYDGPIEGAYCQLNLLTVAKGWDGDGNMGLAWRMTPQSNPGVTNKPMVTIAASDADGVPNTHVYGAGYSFMDATKFGYATALTPTASTPGTSGEDFTPDHHVVCVWVPFGNVGDDTNPAADTDGTFGVFNVVMKDGTSQSLGDVGVTNGQLVKVNNGLGLVLCAGFDAAVAENPTMEVKIEIAYVPIFPAGTNT